jgi:hypothetical protein
MEAFEFHSTALDGFIRIPDRLIDKIAQNIKVIVLNEEREISEKTPFPYFAVDTTDYVFDREEANER